ncbi:L-threonine O-3-phosphate decarboxylase [Hyella patelloides LEGE 07179]|uniref:threonine-phosphate decarboxylase n=1 Tax=Hyella patelloides LEGE 07179 TaxID=945734 RepID=A0A563VWV6_9CYAN|nr:threonine-phosphate decarboxylase CobD [Hyella patelloides]VEP15906.1 L-threonine O-3-phosphate decarboxylase [Hyella patelloides LEGE 07179]
MTRPNHGGNLTWAANIAGCPTSSIIDFSASINPWGIPQTVVTAIEEDIPRLTAYPNPEYPRLRNCLAKDCNVGADYVLPGNGSAELLTWAAKDLLQQEETYLIAPAFGDYYRALRAFGAKINVLTSKLPFGDLDTLIPDRLPCNSGLLLNNPHNPTGKLWQKAEIIPYLSKFALVIIDEAFMDFLRPSQQQSLIDLVPDFPNLVILRSLTKFYSIPGLRIGYAVTYPHRIQQWQQYRDPWSVNSLAATAAITAIKDRDFQQDTWNWLATARESLFQGLKAISGLQPLPGAVNFLLVRSEISVTLLQEKLLQQYQILIRDCLSFPELGDRYFRIAVRTPQENQLLLKAIESVINK